MLITLHKISGKQTIVDVKKHRLNNRYGTLSKNCCAQSRPCKNKTQHRGTRHCSKRCCGWRCYQLRSRNRGNRCRRSSANRANNLQTCIAPNGTDVSLYGGLRALVSGDGAKRIGCARRWRPRRHAQSKRCGRLVSCNCAVLHPAGCRI